MRWKMRPFAALLFAGFVLALVGVLMAIEDDGALAAPKRHRPKPQVTIRGPLPVPAVAPGPPGIQVAYRLDPWMVSGNYGSGFWASPPVLGPATQGGKEFVVQARVEGFDASGAPIRDPQWTPAEHSLVNVNRNRDNNVEITVKKAGQTKLGVAGQGMTKELVITAEDNGVGLLVRIAQ